MCTQAAEQQQLLQRCESSQPPQEPTAVAHIHLGGSLRDAPTAKAPTATAADGKVIPIPCWMLSDKYLDMACSLQADTEPHASLDIALQALVLPMSNCKGGRDSCPYQGTCRK